MLIGVTLSAVLGGLTIEQALAGYADKSVWLVMAAIIISRGLVNTGLGRRIALFFVRAFGKSSLGVCYALAMSDMVLAGMIPSNSARSGGIIMPIARSIAELYGSKPGATAGLLGSFLFAGVYQSICVTAAMFYTGQASNPLAAHMAGLRIHSHVGGAGRERSFPALVSLLVIPMVVMRMNRPEIVRTPEAAAFAARELESMGPLKHGEKILTLVFICVCGLWATSSWTKIDITVTALLGAMLPDRHRRAELGGRQKRAHRLGHFRVVWRHHPSEPGPERRGRHQGAGRGSGAHAQRIRMGGSIF